MRNLLNKLCLLTATTLLCSSTAWAANYSVKGKVVVDYGDMIKQMVNAASGNGVVTVTVIADGKTIATKQVDFAFAAVVGGFLGSSKTTVSVPKMELGP